MTVDQYLERIHVSLAEKPCLDFLAKLQAHHLTSIPFENIDVMEGRKIILGVKDLFDKIIIRKRGGFCYELNGLFAWLLQRLGFSVTMVSARVFGNNTYGPEFDHMALLVELENTYLVDVGSGDTIRTPIPLPGGRAEDISGQYRIFQEDIKSKRFILQYKEKDQ